MARTPPSPADQLLIDSLRRLDIEVSQAQLERWRHVGLIDRNKRWGHARGQGSISSLPDKALFRSHVVAAHAGQGIDIRKTIGKVFLAFPEFDLPERAVREALPWLVDKILTSPRRRRLVARAAALRSHGVADVDDLADSLAPVFGTSRGAAGLIPGLDAAAMNDLLLAGTLGFEAVGYERLIDIQHQLDQQPGDGLLQILIDNLERALSVGTERSSPSFATAPEQRMRELLEDVTWTELRESRDLMFAFGRRMSAFQMFVWMKDPRIPTQFFAEGLINMNVYLLIEANFFPAHVRSLLRPTLFGGLASLRGLLEEPAIAGTYMLYFIEKFDEFYLDNARNLLREIDSPEYLRTAQATFPTAARL